MKEIAPAKEAKCFERTEKIWSDGSDQRTVSKLISSKLCEVSKLHYLLIKGNLSLLGLLGSFTAVGLLVTDMVI